MENNITNKVLEYMDKLGETISSGAEYGFEVMVRQHFVSGVVDIVTCSLVIAALVVGWFFAIKISVRKWDEIYENDLEIPLTVIAIFACVGTLVALGISIGSLAEGVKVVINPEYYAIQDILDTIKGGE